MFGLVTGAGVVEDPAERVGVERAAGEQVDPHLRPGRPSWVETK